MRNAPHSTYIILTGSLALFSWCLKIAGLSPLPMIGSTEVNIEILRIDQIIDQKWKTADIS
jgi:hypothetical protein